MTVFGTKGLRNCQGGCIRHFSVLPRVLAGVEIGELARQITKSSNSNALAAVAAQLVSMGFTEDIAMWAASNSSGSNVEEHTMNAFAILSNES